MGPDPHHALGLVALAPGLAVAAGPSPFAAALAAQGWTVHRHRRHLPSTTALLGAPDVAGFLAAEGRSDLIVFKASHSLEVLARARGWRLLAAPARLARRWENKVAFLELAGASGLRVPDAVVVDPADAEYAALAARLGGRFVLQAAHGFGGRRTVLVASAGAMDAARGVVRGPRARASKLIQGPSWTQTGCVTGHGVVLGSPAFQITGEGQLTPLAMGSCGNDWTLPLPAPREAFDDPCRRVGAALEAGGHRGLYGVDFVVAADGTVYVVEVNPRLVASVGLEADLDVAAGRMPLSGRHLLAFLAPDIETPPPADSTGTQVGAQLILHNRLATEQTVTREVAAAVYTLTGDGLRFARPALTTSVLDNGEWLVLPAPLGRRLAPGAEAGRLLRRRSVVTPSGRLGEDAAEAAAALERALGITGPRRS